MMKVLLVNGSPHKSGCTYTALSEVASALKKEGVAAEIFWLGTKPVHGCIACGKCGELGKCVFDDDVCNELINRMQEADGIIIGSPVYYSGPNGALCAVLDRVFYSSAPALAHKPAAAIVSCRRGGASASFDRLNKYFAINRMPVVTSQYWNSVHGSTPEEVKKDLEGLQTMRTLGREMAWMLKSIEKARIDPPAEEPPVATNFIR
jgi:multimeric flavodoxin WrbA